MDIEPAVIAASLTRGQRSAVRCMDTSPCLLGCADPFAKRLSVATNRRPALTFTTKSEDGRYDLYGLTVAGSAIKEFC